MSIKLTALFYFKTTLATISSNSQIPCLCKSFEAAVVSLLDIIGETTAGQLPARQMISQTLTAYSLVATAGIRAVAIVKILIFITFHNLIFLFQKLSERRHKFQFLTDSL